MKSKFIKLQTVMCLIITPSLDLLFSNSESPESNSIIDIKLQGKRTVIFPKVTSDARDKSAYMGHKIVMKRDLDRDGIDEMIVGSYGKGVSDKSLSIAVQSSTLSVSTIRPPFGIQPNFEVLNTDDDKDLELVVWSGLWDFRMPGEGNVTDETYEGHSSPHRQFVFTYKLLRGEFYLWNVRTTAQKYEPWSHQIPGE